MKKKIFITGVAGFIGSRLAQYILDNYSEEYEVWGVDDMSGGFSWNIPNGVDFANTTIVPLQYHFELCNPDIVYHCAAYAAEGLSPFIREYNYANNVGLTSKIINLCINYNVQRLVFFSSIAVYGQQELPFREFQTPKPKDPYGVAKYACEMDIAIAGEQHGLDWCIVRPANVYGPHQNIWDNYRNVLGIWMRQALNKEPMRVFGDGKQKRAFTYIDDILEPLFQAGISKQASKEVFNLVNDTQFSILWALEEVRKVSDWYKVDHQPERHEVKLAWSDSNKAKLLLNFDPKTTLDYGVSEMWTWAKENYHRVNQSELWQPKYEVTIGMYDSWKK